MLEDAIKKNVRLTLSQRFGTCIFNNPVGRFFAGKFVEKKGNLLTIAGGRFVQCGLFPGMPDLIGWRRIVITPDMVGKFVAVFVGVETKTSTNKNQANQALVQERLKKDGALCGVARCAEDLEVIMTRLEGPSLTDFALRISPELHASLAAEAEREGVSLNQYVLYALSQKVRPLSDRDRVYRVSVDGFEELFEAPEEA